MAIARTSSFLGAFVAASLLAGCTEEPIATPARELKLAAEDGAAKDAFGVAVSLSGDTAAIGAVFDDDLGQDSGSAYTFVRADNGSWSQESKLVPPNGQANDWFGSAIAISKDTLIVGAPNASENGIATGTVHVYFHNGSEWTHQATLAPKSGAADDQFGYALALDGDTILIGAPGDDEVAMDAGAAYLFKRAGSSWNEETKLVPTPGGASGFFGASVAISQTTALVGAWDDGSAKNAGVVFTYTTDGSAWTPETTLVPTDPTAQDIFGYSLSLSNNTALIGAHGNDAHGADSGAAYIFMHNGTKWDQDQKLAPKDGAVGDAFGYSVGIWNDLAIIGAYWDDDRGDFSGSAYTFALTNGHWIEKDKHAPNDGIPGQKFGCSVAIDGDIAIAGAFGDTTKDKESGSAYVFSSVDTLQ